MKRILIFIFTLLFGWHAFAENAMAKRFRQAALTAVEKAQARGDAEIQGIVLTDFKAYIGKVLIYSNNHVILQQVGRRCAYWARGTDFATAVRGTHAKSVSTYIQLNPACADLNDEDLQQLALHEMLGVYSGKDRNYEISTEIFMGPVFKDQMINSIKMNRLKDAKANAQFGGSTGVGGGGDNFDIRFKTEGLKYLQRYEAGQFIYGIPVEVIEAAIRSMKVSAASDVEKLVAFIHSQAFINVGFYRGQDTQNFGKLAVILARLFILHSSQDINLSDGTAFGSFAFNTSVIQRPLTIIPMDDPDQFIQLKNNELYLKLSPQEQVQLEKTESVRAKNAWTSNEFQDMLRIEQTFFNIY